MQRCWFFVLEINDGWKVGRGLSGCGSQSCVKAGCRSRTPAQPPRPSELMKREKNFCCENYFLCLPYLRTGLETASGVAMPMALILCCIVGVADEEVRLPVPIRGTADCCICWTVMVWSGDSASGVYVLFITSSFCNSTLEGLFAIDQLTDAADADWTWPGRTSSRSVASKQRLRPSVAGRNCSWSHVAAAAASARNLGSARPAAPCLCHARGRAIAKAPWNQCDKR